VNKYHQHALRTGLINPLVAYDLTSKDRLKFRTSERDLKELVFCVHVMSAVYFEEV
jgi:hypothetical protein